jgi:putative tryptophan/tyrosine transport system substrate-binding protein
MNRREFIALVGGAAATWPLAAHAQQPATPVIGFMNAGSAAPQADRLAAFREGLREAAYIEGQNVRVEYRWAENKYDRLTAMAADLVRQRVSVIAATSTPAAVAAKAATTVIPIVFETASDPIKIGLVATLRRPGGNITGVTTLHEEIAPKRLELLHELIPTASVIALLVNPADAALTDATIKSLQTAADTLGLRLHVLHASTEHDFDAVFANLGQLRAGGLVIGPDSFFVSRSTQLAGLTVRYAVPAIFEGREFVTTGGLISYSGSFIDSYRLAGVYTGRILKGEKPSELPVQQATKVELFLNLRTAKALGITVPLPLSGRADEVIE